MKYFIVSLIIIYLSELGLGQNYSCSGFVIKNNNDILLAKNLDWALGNGLIIFNPKNKLKCSIYAKSKKNSWTSKYSSITFNHLGLNQPLGGMNEEGLTIEELSTWPAEYFNKNNFIVNEFEWIQYQLDNYSTTEEVLANIEKISISKFYFLIHYLITDNSGNIAIVEFIDGKPKVFQGEFLSVPVLTNNNYSELIKYLNSVSKSHLNKLNINQSQDRFLKISSLLKSRKNINVSKNYLYAMKLLDSVKVSDTKWSIVYDIRNRIIYYKTENDTSIRNVSYRPNNFRQNDYRFIKIERNNQFKIFHQLDNNNYLDKLKTDIYKQFGDKGSDLIQKINRYMK